ncbi:MAG: zonular occludens toxin domain-containing protein [Methylococcales bacterium]|nr:zonular occludens toxin domain-containing protein [Methylococcales bacterium]
MATSIHHGAPGSFKSFSLVQRFAIPALKAGRTVVCNVRGFDSLDRIIEQFPDTVFPESAQLIYLETTTREARMIMAGWFHWVPIGAMIIIDEGQEIYPDRKDFKLESLDTFVCPDGFEVEETQEPRPVDVFTAYDKQRHYQWDIFISTTNVAKIKSEIRQVTEWAYRHRSLAGLFPWMKTSWVEHQHDAETNGKSDSHRVGSPVRYKADPRIFKCYKSTATGEVTESQAGQSILKNPVLLLPVFGIFLGIFLFVYSFSNSSDKAKSVESVKPISPVSPSSVPTSIVQNGSVKTDVASVGAVSAIQMPAALPFGYDLISIAYNDVHDLTKIKFNYLLNGAIKTIGLDYFVSQGVKFVSRGICAVDLIAKDGQKLSLNCETPVIASCSVSIKSDSVVSYRGCSTVNQLAESKSKTFGMPAPMLAGSFLK